MPLPIASGAPTLFIRRAAYERSGLARATLDQKLNLTDEEFRVERDLVAIGPLYEADLSGLLDELEEMGLVYYDDFFEVSGSWPDWLNLFVSAREGA